MEVKIITQPISVDKLKKIAHEFFVDMVKMVIDIEEEILAAGGELHSDEEQVLLENNSKQRNLWGINYYFDKEGDEKIEFDSMINIRSMQGNPSRSIENPEIQQKIREIVKKLII